MEQNKSKNKGIDRRKFLARGGAALVGAAVSGMGYASELRKGNSNDQRLGFQRGSYKDMVKKALEYRKMDCHNHTGDISNMIESMDRMGIQRVAISDLEGPDTPESIRASNDLVLKIVKQHPNRFLGQCRINPGYTKEAIHEIDRCIDSGMVMLGELYDEYKINDPVYFPIIERCIEHKIPLLVHNAATLGLWRKGYSTMGSALTTSTAADFVDIGQRYPEALIICAHIGGGGDWEYACKMLGNAPSIYVDTSGSVTDEAMLDLAVEHIGVDRLLFGTDVNYETGVGKIMHAKLTEEERKRIFFDNFNNLLRKGGNHVN
jgi:predicted TIM-barrel fold metal-dependent hydrolase